jgi:hypothetical protein
MTNEPLASELAAIDRLLAAKRPEVHRSLRAGAAPATLAGVPPPVAALFAWHDGQQALRSLSPESRWCLHSIESAREAARSLGDGFPVLDDGAGDHIVFDGATGALIEHRQDDEERPRAWDGVIAWARALRAELEEAPAPVELTAAQRWILAVGGVLTHMNDDDHARLGFAPVPEGAERAAAILRDAWDVRTMVQAASRLEWLLGSGHRASYDDPHIAAWDLGRAVNVAGWSYAAGLLDAPTAWAFMTRAAAAAQAAFGSWAELGASYAAGRARWLAQRPPGGDDTLDEAPAAVAALLAPGGPWAELPWATPLGGAAVPPDGRRELRVAPGDGTLAAALAAAPTNARLVLAPGEYRGSIAIDRHVELVAQGGLAIVVADVSPAIDVDGACAFLRGVDVRAIGGACDAIRVDDGRLVMDRCRVTATGHGLELRSGSAEAALRGCAVRDCGGGAIVVESGHLAIELSELHGGAVGVQLAGEADAVVERCRVLDTRGIAIAVAEDAVAVVDDCELARAAGHALQLTDRAKARVHVALIHHGAKAGVLVGPFTSLHMTRSTVHDQGGTGVWVEASKRVHLFECALARNGECGLSVHGGGAVRAEKLAIDGGPDDAVWIDTSHAVLAEVRVIGAGGCGVRVEEGTASLSSLEIRGCAGSGVYAGRGAKVTLDRARLIENANVGVEAGETSDVVATGCTVAGNAGDEVFAYEGARCRLEACEVRGGPGTALSAHEDGAITVAGGTITAGAKGAEHAESGGRIDHAGN